MHGGTPKKTGSIPLRVGEIISNHVSAEAEDQPVVLMTALARERRPMASNYDGQNQDRCLNCQRHDCAARIVESQS